VKFFMFIFAVFELLSVFNMAAVRYFILLKCVNFNLPQFLVEICKFLQNPAAIGWTVTEILQIFGFQYGGRPPSWISEICKI